MNQQTHQSIDPQAVIQAVCDDLNISIEYLRSPDRKPPLSMARAIITHALRSRTSLSWNDITWLIGCSSHSSLIEANRKLIAGQYDRNLLSFVPDASSAREYAMTVCDRIESQVVAA